MTRRKELLASVPDDVDVPGFLTSKELVRLHELQGADPYRSWDAALRQVVQERLVRRTQRLRRAGIIAPSPSPA